MNLLRLALETSGPVGSVAVARGGEVLARAFLEEPGAHAGGLIPALDAVLEEAGVPRSDLGGVVVGEGPGSFTGVRVAAATAKGLAHALDLPLWNVSSLAAAAATDLVLPPGVGPWSVPRDLALLDGLSVLPDVPRYVLFDARGERVYAACYRFLPGVESLVEPRATTLGEVLAAPLPRGACFVGAGALRHRDTIRDRGHQVLPPPAGMPTADGLIRLLSPEGATAPLADPGRWEPAYLRASGAERIRGR